MQDGNEGLVSKILTWLTSASYDDSTLKEWLYGLALVLIIAFLWSTVVRQVIEPAAEAVGEVVG